MDKRENWGTRIRSERFSQLAGSKTADGTHQRTTESESIPPDLGELINAWGKLSESQRAAVVAVLRSFGV